MTDSTPPSSGLTPEQEDQRKQALSVLLDAWDRAYGQGLSAEAIASAAIYAALTDMVDLFGEEPVAQMTEELPARIRRGEFTLKKER